MASPICVYGNPVLREKSEPVKEVTAEIRALADRMLGIMYSQEGIGLAAEQIGHTEAIFVLDVPVSADKNDQGLPNNPGVKMPQTFINPEIIGESEETAVAEEGCLSFPKLYVPVERPAEVVLRFLDRDGNTQVLNARGLLARAIQHELDHLDGVLLVDHMTPAMKLKNALRLRGIKKWYKSRGY
ncbi:MAG: peptide deformylase [Verrucomicrobia bacterium]|nr:peptide deformylase [Verrucomicrobiota bacterium]